MSRENNTMKENFFIYLKGIAMGLCDLVPGISGGTIALITGIYQRFITALSHFNPKVLTNLIKYFFSKKKKLYLKEIKKLDLIFLLILFSGILTAIVLGSKLMNYLLTNYLNFTFAFFVGLIIASLPLINKHIEKDKSRNFLILGFILGFSIYFLKPHYLLEPSLLYVFFGGFVAITAMLLPGISGSFILLILGLYSYIIEALSELNFLVLLIFILGTISGIISSSKFISYLLEKHKTKTLSALLGLVVGTIAIPLSQVFTSMTTFENTLISIACLLVGMLIPFTLKNLE